MARIAGVDIPRDKRVVVSLTYIYGIGLSTAQKICAATGISEDVRVKDLTEEEEGKLRKEVENYKNFGIQYFPLYLKEGEIFVGCCGLRPYNKEKNIFSFVHIDVRFNSFYDC